VLPLHGSLTSEEQRRIFQRPPPGVRKIVLATNIAETSITIDDCGYVIDCGRMKETRYDPARRMESLEDVAVSRANARQRRGRAGRVMSGVAFHLVSRHTFEQRLEAAQAPEMHRVPLEQLVLRIKVLRYPGTAADVVARCLEPPAPEAVSRAVSELVRLEALSITPERGEELTPLGTHLAALPVDVRIGKLILLGAIFNVVDDVLTIAAVLSYRAPFLSPFERRTEADASKRAFAVSQSDHLTAVNAYREFDRGGAGRFDMCRERFLGVKTLIQIAGVKRQLLELLSDARFVRPGLRSRAVEVRLPPRLRRAAATRCRAALTRALLLRPRRLAGARTARTASASRSRTASRAAAALAAPATHASAAASAVTRRASARRRTSASGARF
jgi:HrpA-like RNA helicase